MADIPQELMAKIIFSRAECRFWNGGYCRNEDRCRNLHMSYVDNCGRRWSGNESRIPNVSLCMDPSTKRVMIKLRPDSYIAEALLQFFQGSRRPRTLHRGKLLKVRGQHCISFCLEHMERPDRAAITRFDIRDRAEVRDAQGTLVTDKGRASAVPVSTHWVGHGTYPKTISTT